MKRQTIIDKVFKDKDGKVVLMQAPNGPILLWAISEVFSEFIAHGTFQKLCSFVAFGALFTWAWMEIFSGVNYFRRGLGVVVLIFSLYSKIK